MEKVYVARVLGTFPDQPVTLDAALAWDVANHVATVVPDGPRWTDGEDSAGGGRGSVKPAATSFVRLAVAPDGRTSVVECRPLTGRSHQIRCAVCLGEMQGCGSGKRGTECKQEAGRGVRGGLGGTLCGP